MDYIILSEPQLIFHFDFDSIINLGKDEFGLKHSSELTERMGDDILNRKEIITFRIIHSGRCDSVVFWYEIFSQENIIVTSSPFYKSGQTPHATVQSLQALQHLFIGSKKKIVTASDKEAYQEEKCERWLGKGEKRMVREGEKERVIAKHNASRIWFDFESEERDAMYILHSVKVFLFLSHTRTQWRVIYFLLNGQFSNNLQTMKEQRKKVIEYFKKYENIHFMIYYLYISQFMVINKT